MFKSILLSLLLICSGSSTYAQEYKTYTGIVQKVDYPNYYFSFTAPCQCSFCPQPHQFTVKVESDDKVPPMPIEGETCTVKLRIEREKGCPACLKKGKVRYYELFRYNPRYIQSRRNIFRGRVIGVIYDAIDLGCFGVYDYALVDVTEYVCGKPWEMVYVAFKDNEYKAGQEYMFNVVEFRSNLLEVKYGSEWFRPYSFSGDNSGRTGIFRLQSFKNKMRQYPEVKR